MSRREYASRILTELCSDLGLPAAEMQPDGLLTLAFDDIRVTFRHVTTPLETLVLLVDLGELPADAGQAAAMLLELNLVTWGRNNLTIGLGADGRQTRHSRIAASPSTAQETAASAAAGKAPRPSRLIVSIVALGSAPRSRLVM